jgi:IS30 family transposase
MGTQYSHLSESERFQIEALSFAGWRDSQIAKVLRRHRSTIARERQRGLWADFGRYIAQFGSQHYAPGPSQCRDGSSQARH